MKRILKYVMFSILLVFVFVPFSQVRAENENQIHLTVLNMETKESVKGIPFAIYKIADETEDTIIITPEFTGSNLDIKDLYEKEDAAKTADMLETYIQEQKLQQIDKQISDADGKLSFQNLTDGIYFIREVLDEMKEEELGYRYVTSPFIVSVPGVGENGVRTSIIECQPKGELDYSGYYKDGSIIIHKKVVRNGEPEKIKEILYFAIFEDADYQKLIEANPLELDDASEGTLTFSKLSYGTYYIAEVDEIGQPVDESFAYTVTVDKEECTLSEDHEEEVVTIVNEVKERTPSVTPEVTPSVTPNVTPGGETPTGGTPSRNTSGNSTGGSSSTTGVKTGDDTPIVMYVLLALVAAAITGVTIFWKRKKSK